MPEELPHHLYVLIRAADRYRFGVFEFFFVSFLMSACVLLIAAGLGEVCMEHIRACRRRMTRLISGATRYNDTFTNVLYMVTMEKKYPRTLTFENVAGRVGGRVLRDGAAWYI